MLGVDLGLNVGSIIVLRKRIVKDSHVFKFTHEKESESRLHDIAKRYALEIRRRCKRFKDNKVAIEEPVFSWGRKNPKAFAKLVELRALIIFLLPPETILLSVNNKTAKKKAGHGGKDKSEMVKAYKMRTGVFPGHQTKYGMETLADSYFIALVGYDQWDTHKDERKS